MSNNFTQICRMLDPFFWGQWHILFWLNIVFSLANNADCLVLVCIVIVLQVSHVTKMAPMPILGKIVNDIGMKNWWAFGLPSLFKCWTGADLVLIYDKVKFGSCISMETI